MLGWCESSVGDEFPLGWEPFHVADLACYDHGGVEVYAGYCDEYLDVFLVAGGFGDLDGLRLRPVHPMLLRRARFVLRTSWSTPSSWRLSSHSEAFFSE